MPTTPPHYDRHVAAESYRIWRWWPDLEGPLIVLACDKLPISSSFQQFLVHSAAYLWLSQPDEDCATKLQILRNLDTNFANEVGLVQAQRLQYYVADKGHIPTDSDDWEERQPCMFHEHRVYDEEQCKKRFEHESHVILSIMEACIKDGLAMASKLEEQ